MEDDDESSDVIHELTTIHYYSIRTQTNQKAAKRNKLERERTSRS